MSPYFVVFELLVYALLACCLHHAWRAGGGVRVWEALAGVIFGVLLEWATIQQLAAYEYGRFMIMLGEVPIAVGVGWGVIIYSARLFTNATDAPGWLRPVLNGLLALNIDLSMDAVAIRLGFWDWGRGLDFQYFGVPYANFWAWFWVVFSFTAGLQALTRRARGAGKWLAPAGAIGLGVAGVLGTNWLIVSGVPAGLRSAVIAVALLGALLLALRFRPRVRQRIPALAAWAPAGFHIYFLNAGVFSGSLQIPFLLAASLLMATIALYLHRTAFLK